MMTESSQEGSRVLFGKSTQQSIFNLSIPSCVGGSES